MNMDVVTSYLITNVDYKARYETQSDDAIEIAKYEAKQTIFNLGLKFWDGLSLFMLKQDCLSIYQKNYVISVSKKLRSNIDLTDNEIDKGVRILESLSKQKIDFEEVKLLSKVEDDSIENVDMIFNYIQSIKSDEWKQIIEIGETTGILSDNEISAIKVVVQKIKTKSNIDIIRLRIVKEVLDKMKKFSHKAHENSESIVNNATSQDFDIIQPEATLLGSVLTIRFPDGKEISNNNVAKLLSEVIEFVGPEKVSTIGIKNRFELVSKNKYTGHYGAQQMIEGGWLVYTHSSTQEKILQIERISKELNLNLEIIHNNTGK
jgi:hypothetical protein